MREQKKIPSMFLVEDGYNTSYIDSLLVALFYSSSYFENMLNCSPKNLYHIYLQEIFKIKFLEPLVNKNNTITSEVINEIRNYIHFFGWKNDEGDKILENYNIKDFYIFLADIFNVMPMEIQKTNHTKQYFTLDIQVNSLKKEYTIKELLYNWLHDDQINYKNDTGYNYYKICNMPTTIIISLERTADENILVDINKKIRLYNTIYNPIYVKWKIHSIVCKNKNYYCFVIGPDNKWRMFNNKNIPCISEVNIKEENIMKMIKSECIMLFYVYDKVT